MGPDIGALQVAVADALAGYGGPVAVMSFNPHTVAAFGAVAPDLPRGLTTSGWDHGDALRLPAERRAHLAAIADFEPVGASFISHDWHDLANPRVAELKARGVPILCWTIRSAAAEVTSPRDRRQHHLRGLCRRPPCLTRAARRCSIGA